MLKVLLVACMSALVISISEDDFDRFVQFTQKYGKTSDEFDQFTQKYGKTYSSRTEANLRAAIFAQNLKKIEEHNKSGSSWTMGVSEFADMTEAEFQSIYVGGYKKLPSPGLGNTGSVKAKTLSELPASVDWRQNNTISAVKNQGRCGSCG